MTCVLVLTSMGNCNAAGGYPNDAARQQNDAPLGFSPMARAAMDGNVDEIKKLAAAGHSLNGEPNDTLSPLMWAAHGGHAKLAKILLELGADPNYRSGNGETALTEAAASGHLHIVRLLVTRHADVNAREVERTGGYTPLMYAAANGYDEVVDYLTSHGANIRATNREGKTAAQLAEAEGYDDLSKRLLSQLQMAPPGH